MLLDSAELLSKVVATIYTPQNNLQKCQFPFQKLAIFKNVIDWKFDYWKAITVVLIYNPCY